LLIEKKIFSKIKKKMKYTSLRENKIAMLCIALTLFAFSAVALFFTKKDKPKKKVKKVKKGGESKKEAFSAHPSPNDKFHLFHATWCGHCVNFGPTFQEFKGTNLIETAEHEHSSTPESLKQEFGVKGYPTMCYENAKGENKQYEGPRTIDGITSFIKTERSKSN
jgi:thiol-disulfide isomerase/thioredoxin